MKLSMLHNKQMVYWSLPLNECRKIKRSTKYTLQKHKEESLNSMTKQESATNRPKLKSSGHVGINYIKKSNKWRVGTRADNKSIYIGVTDTVEEGVILLNNYKKTHNIR